MLKLCRWVRVGAGRVGDAGVPEEGTEQGAVRDRDDLVTETWG